MALVGQDLPDRICQTELGAKTVEPLREGGMQGNMQRLKPCWRILALAAGLILACGWPGGGALQAQSNAAKGAAGSEVAQLRNRVQQLEEQLVDVQVVIGTLESLARSGPRTGGNASVATGGGVSGGDAGRIAALETQIRALTAQVQQLSQAGSRAPAPATQGWQSGGAANPQGQGGPGGQGSPAGGSVAGFGSTTVQPGSGDQIGSIIANNSPSGGGAATTSVAAGSDAQQNYEAAYGLLLQQDYGAAQAAFSDFIKRHGNHALAGNAQYWLGETYYVQGQYKSAAGAFLKGYRSYGSSAKAPDSLLKLAMSLDRLGQRSAACSSLSELGTKFPQAAAHVKRRASQERRRLRC